jgi:hypothetical protein
MACNVIEVSGKNLIKKKNIESEIFADGLLYKLPIRINVWLAAHLISVVLATQKRRFWDNTR